MTIEITILGTACMQPTKRRNHVGILLKYKKEALLFECGENIQRQLRIANLKPSKITKIFISHWHGDHVLGLPGLMNTLAKEQPSKKIQIYGPSGFKKKLSYLFKAFPSKEVISPEIKEIKINKKEKKKLDFTDFLIEVCTLEHGVPCLGYSFLEKDKRKIKTKYTQKVPGPLLGKLQKGFSITYQGKKITPKEATFLVKGKKITIIMDTRPCDNFLKLAQKADLLISEATYLQKHKEKAEEYYHLTAREVAFLANQAQVKKLVLLHFSQRYKDLQEIREEIKTVFKKAVCAEDFMKFKI